MIAFALKLILAHLLGDFVLQPDKMVQDKRRRGYKSPYLFWHLAIHALALLLLLEFKSSYFIGIAVIVISHFLIDVLKLNLEARIPPVAAFTLDQLAHLLVIGGVTYFYYPYPIHFGWLSSNEVLLFLIAICSVTYVSAILMKLIMGTWNIVEDKDEDSLPRAGKYIGMLERLFVFMFIILHQWQAIGLLIAAKSIFRFSDLSRAKDRKLTEYVLIGTLLSFGLAFLVGLLFLYFSEDSFKNCWKETPVRGIAHVVNHFHYR